MQVINYRDSLVLYSAFPTGLLCREYWGNLTTILTLPVCGSESHPWHEGKTGHPNKSSVLLVDDISFNERLHCDPHGATPPIVILPTMLYLWWGTCVRGEKSWINPLDIFLLVICSMQIIRKRFLQGPPRLCVWPWLHMFSIRSRFEQSIPDEASPCHCGSPLLSRECHRDVCFARSFTCAQNT